MKPDLMDSSLYKEYLLNDKILAPSTTHHYVVILEGFLKGNPDIEDSESYNQYIIAKAFKKRSYYTYYALKKYIEFKITDKKLKEKLLESLRKPSMNLNIIRERRSLNDEQIFNVIAAIKEPKHQIIALIQKITGLRAGDIFNIKKDSVLEEEYQGQKILRIATLGKRKKRHVVEIFDPICQDVIKNYIKELGHETYFMGKTKKVDIYEDYIFIEYSLFYKNQSNEFNDIKFANYVRYWNDLKIAMNKCGIMKESFATHDFRRGFARKVWLKFKDLYILQKVLGHNDPRTTMRYLHQEGLDLVDVHKQMQE